MATATPIIAVPFSVLLVDRDDTRRRSLVRCIEREDLDAITCANVEEALTILEWHRSSVAVVAPTPQGGLALEVADRLRRQMPTLLVVLLGAVSGEANRNDAQRSWLHVAPDDDPDALVLVLYRLFNQCLLDALGSREDRYRTMLETTGGVMVHLTEELRVQAWNPAAEALFGHKRSEVLGRHYIKNMLPESCRAEIRDAIDLVLAGATRQGVEHAILLPDGSQRTAIWNISPLANADGRPGVLLVGQDISRRKQLEEELREAQRLQRQITETVPEHIGVYDLAARRTMYSNGRLSHMLGHAEGSLRNHFGTDFLPEILHGNDVDGLELLLHQLETQDVVTSKHTLNQRDGKASALVVRNVVFDRTADNKVHRLLTTVLDVTESEEAERALRSSREELRQLAQHLQSVRDEERGHIAREIHDQLGQELTALKIHMAMLRNSELSPDPMVSEIITTMTELVTATSETVRRISRELHPNPTAHMGLVPAIRWKIEESARRFGFKSRFIPKVKNVKLEPKRETHVIHILQEALTNVARHAQATQVEVELDVKDDRHLVLTIADDGKGISEEQIATGKSIGLIGMRERAHLSGGELTIFCAPGTGTIIVARIPLSPEDDEPRTGTIRIADLPRFSGPSTRPQ